MFGNPYWQNSWMIKGIGLFGTDIHKNGGWNNAEIKYS